jgi:hypothetical protein
LASVTRIIGPDFLDQESREAFERVAETIRQYAVHSRETVVLARSPFSLPHDHFALLWSRGAAIVFLYNRGGRIVGGAENVWTETSTEGIVQAERRFENPLAIGSDGCKQLVDLLKNFHREHPKEDRAVAGLPTGELSPDGIATNEQHWDSIEIHLKTIALFTRPVKQLEVSNSIKDLSFIATTLEHVTSRTIFHLPNLLRITDANEQLFDTQELQLLSNALGREGELNKGERELKTNEATTLIRVRRTLQRRRGVLLTVILVALTVITVAIILVTSRHPPVVVGTLPTGRDTSKHIEQIKPERKSTVIIDLQQPAQLFVTAEKFETRSALDNAIANGDGIRSYPSLEHVFSLDSSQFGKGVYGYFKVDNMWRKGKLLQTFNVQDTFKIDNFLAPLP